MDENEQESDEGSSNIKIDFDNAQSEDEGELDQSMTHKQLIRDPERRHKSEGMVETQQQ